MTFFKSVLMGGFIRLSTLVFGFLSSVIVARVLGADENGIVAYSIWLATTAASVADLGLPNALSRYGDGYRDGVDWKDQASTLFLPFVATSLALTAAFVLWGALRHGQDAQDDALFWFTTAALLIAVALAAYTGAVARGLREIHVSSIETLIGCLLQVPAVLVGAWWFGVPGAIFGYILRYLPQAIGVARYVDPRRMRSVQVPRRVTTMARDAWVSNLLGMLIWTRLEFVFIGFYCDSYQLGYYTVGMSLASLMIQLPLQLSAEIVPFLGRLHDDENHAEIERLYRGMARAMALLMFPICLGGAAITPRLLVVLFGAEFEPAARMSEVLVALSAASALATVPTSLLMSREKTNVLLRAAPVAGGAMILGLLVVVPFGAGLGAAWVRGAIHLAWFLGLALFVQRVMRLSLPTGALLKTLAAAIACALAARMTVDELPHVAGIVAAVGVGAVVYVFVLRITRAIDLSEMDGVVGVLDRMPSGAARRVLAFALAVVDPHVKVAAR